MGRAVQSSVAGCRLPELRPSCMLQMVDHLRLVGPEFLEKILGQRLGSRQPKPIALERDRAAGALHRLDEGKSAHGAASQLGRVRATLGVAAQRAAGIRRWAVPLVSFGWRLVSFWPETARRIPQRFQCAGQFGQFGQFWNHRSRRVAQFARAPPLSTARSSAGRVISRPPSRPRRANHVLPDPYVLFSAQTDQTDHGQGIRGFPGPSPGQFRRAGQFRRPMVSSGGQHARSKVQQIAPQALDRVTHRVRAPSLSRAMPAVPARPAASRASAA